MILRKTTQDRRTQKTRKALSEALISLMFEKSYESIVVQDILDRANVGRSTFYTHFRDRDELLVNGLQDLRELLRTAQTAARALADFACPDREAARQFSAKSLHHIRLRAPFDHPCPPFLPLTMYCPRNGREPC